MENVIIFKKKCNFEDFVIFNLIKIVFYTLMGEIRSLSRLLPSNYEKKC